MIMYLCLENQLGYAPMRMRIPAEFRAILLVNQVNQRTTGCGPKHALHMDDDALLDDFVGKPDARVSPYCRAIAREIGGSPGKAAIVAGDIVKKRFAKTRLRQLFHLTTSQFESVLSEAGADPSWRPMFEEAAGMQFQVITCPVVTSSASIEKSRALALEGYGAQTLYKTNTLSVELGSASVSRILVPTEVFVVKITGDSRHYTLKQEEVTQIGNKMVAWMFAKKGKVNLGAPVIRELAKQTNVHYPKISTKKGALTTWLKYLTGKFQVCNRSDATSIQRTLIPLKMIDCCERARTLLLEDRFKYFDVDHSATTPDFPAEFLTDKMPDPLPPTEESQLELSAAVPAPMNMMTINKGALNGMAIAHAIPLNAALPVSPVLSTAMSAYMPFQQPLPTTAPPGFVPTVPGGHESMPFEVFDDNTQPAEVCPALAPAEVSGLLYTPCITRATHSEHTCCGSIRNTSSIGWLGLRKTNEFWTN